MFPRLITIGSFTLPSYGVLVALAFLVALWMSSHFARQRGLSNEKVVNLGVYCALAGMLGAKLLMIALDPDLRTHLSE
ncbi:MAG TPA: prolipoprotein diacylglyceryl transferase family protein, partial [Ktedonobacterales bacterium]|nr:prolipoprotein diacylglyceryl transferase family protein [Ktedonobacterales bacterium]